MKDVFAAKVMRTVSVALASVAALEPSNFEEPGNLGDDVVLVANQQMPAGLEGHEPRVGNARGGEPRCGQRVEPTFSK